MLGSTPVQLQWSKLLQLPIPTKWFVITGAPCSGKTTVINELAKLGYLTVPEAARALIEKCLMQGETLEAIRSNEAAFQKELFELKLDLELRLEANKITILDRALPDSITYYKNAGLDPKPILESCAKFKYSKVFIFDRLPLKADYARNEDEAKAAWLDLELEKDYRALGLDVLRVPVMTVSERTKAIIKFL